MRAKGRTTFVTALSLTFISLVFSQLTAGGQQAQQSKPTSAAWSNTGSMTAGLNPYLQSRTHDLARGAIVGKKAS